MHVIRTLFASNAVPPSVFSNPGRRNFVELVMKNTLVADSSFGTWPAPFCEFPSEAGVRRSGPEVARGEWSPRMRIGVGLSVMAVLFIFVGLTSLLQFGAFHRKADVPTGPRMSEVVKAIDAPPVKEVSVLPFQGDSK
jgi:hypothetical protein